MENNERFLARGVVLVTAVAILLWVACRIDGWLILVTALAAIGLTARILKAMNGGDT